MFNSCNATDYRALHSLITMRMCRYNHSVIFSSCANCFYFFYCKLGILTIFRNAQHATCSSNFNVIRAIFVTLPHGLTCFIRAVNYALLRPWVSHQKFVSTISWVSMTSCSRNSLACSKNSRPYNRIVINGISQCYINPRTTEITYSCKPCQKSNFCIINRFKSNISFICGKLVHVTCGIIFIFHVHMHIDEPWHYSFGF